MNPVAFALNLGFTIAISIGGGTMLGYFADGRFGTKPILTLVGATVGLCISFAYLFINYRKLPK